MQERIESIQEIATLPDVLTRILAVVEDDSTTALDLAEEVERDQALTMRVLKVVNSSYYGFPRAIQSIPETIVILGFREIEQLAVSISVINMFSKTQTQVRALNHLWRHSVACSLAARSLERHFSKTTPNLSGAHIAGLLHDIGKAVIAEYFPEEMEKIAGIIMETDCSAREAELEVLRGYTHEDIGAWIAQKWNLPDDIVLSIRHHHEPPTGKSESMLPHVTHLANSIVNSMGICSFHEGPRHIEPEVETLRLFPMNEALFTSIAESLNKQRGLLSAIPASSQ